MKLKIEKTFVFTLPSIIIGLIIIILNFLYFREFETIFQAINVAAGFIILLPLVLSRYLSYRKKKQIEDMFIVFLRDLVEAIRGGMNLTQALKTVSKNDYKILSKYVKKMSAQLEWGISFEKVLLKFAKETKSKVVGRAVSSIVESLRYGGNITDTLDALSSTAVEIDRLREERRLYLHSQMITGYIIFFVFLGVILGMNKFLVPSLTQAQPIGIEGKAEISAEAYRELFFHLILMQGFFAGLVVGKMAEGAIIAGLKHSIFMMLVGGILFMLFG